MINAFILCDLFEYFRKILQQTEKEALNCILICYHRPKNDTLDVYQGLHLINERNHLKNIFLYKQNNCVGSQVNVCNFENYICNQILSII